MELEQLNIVMILNEYWREIEKQSELLVGCS